MMATTARSSAQAADEAAEWSSNNLAKVNTDKTREMVITFSIKNHPTLATVFVNSNAIERARLGGMLSTDLSWGPHVDYLYGKCAPRLYLLTLLKRAGVAPSDTLRIYTSMIRSALEYGCAIWHTSLTEGQYDKLEYIQKRALRTIFPDKSIPKRCPRSAWTPSSRNVKMHARSCSKTCRNQTTNSTTSCPISETHHTACGPTSSTLDQKQKLTDTKTASSHLLCPTGMQ